MRSAVGQGPRAAAPAAIAALLALPLAGLPWALGGRAQAACQGLLDDLLAALPIVGLPSARLH